jgi:anti-sigma B factor antagonist
MKLTVRQAGDVTILDLSGRILFADGEEDFRAGLRPILESGQVNLLLNMIDVPFVDSAGIGEIVRAHATVKRQGGSLKLMNLGRRVHEALAITQMLTVIEAFDSEEEAIESFRKP